MLRLLFFGLAAAVSITLVAQERSVILPSVSLKGSEITDQAIQRLAGQRWDTVRLSDGESHARSKSNWGAVENLRKATSIRALHLSGHDVARQIYLVKRINGLAELNVNTPMTTRTLEEIAELSNLNSLHLPPDLTISVSGARALARLHNLKSLNLAYVDIDDASFAELGTLVDLEELDLSGTRITDEGLATLQKFPRLQKLELIRHFDPQLTDACLRSILGLNELRYVSLSGAITQEGLKKFVRLPKLKSLSIWNTDISRDGLMELENSSVESLRISSDQAGIDGDGELDLTVIEQLKKCRLLKRVHVTGKHLPSESAREKLIRMAPQIDWQFSG
ncbi:MAG: hypothetical protein JSS49_13050 [Planctomycetes bacterium]|nr:hypothetical protein [Planctomycetota bacterium]